MLPPNWGSSDGWTLMIRPRYASRKGRVWMRSYPASTMSSTLWPLKKSRMATSRSSSEAKAFSDSSASGMFRSRANAAPPHDGRFVATATTSNPRSTRLRRFEPLPETTMPNLIGVPAKSQILWGRVSADHHALGALVLDHLTDDLGAARHLFFVHDQDHAESHVECAKHLVVGDAAALGDQVEDRRLLPRTPAEARAQTLRQAARQVAEDPAARDVRGALPLDGPQLLEVRAMRLEQLLPKRPAQFLVDLGERHSFEHLAHQREPIGVEAARRQPDQNVANANLLRIPDQTRLDHADYETREVVIAEGVHPRHLSGLAAKKRAARFAAGRGHAFDDLSEHLRIELAGGEVVEEEHRPRAGRGDVIHTVIDDVDADAAVRGCSDRDLDLGPDPVGAGREVASAGQGIEACERTHADGHLFAMRRCDQRFDSG